MTAPVVRWVRFIAVAGYVLLVAALVFGERAMLYHPNRDADQSGTGGLAQAADVVFETSDGEKLLASMWRGGKPVVISFHRNGEIVAWRPARHRATIADATGSLRSFFRGSADRPASRPRSGCTRGRALCAGTHRVMGPFAALHGAVLRPHGSEDNRAAMGFRPGHFLICAS